MFLLTVVGVLALMHGYLWLRLARDTTVGGRGRWPATGLIVLLFVAVVVALAVPRLLDVSAPAWLVAPGMLWLAVAFYLVLLLLVFEPVRWLMLRRIARREAAVAVHPDEVTGQRPGGIAAPVARIGVDRRVFLARAGALTAGVASVGLVSYGTATALAPPRVLTVPVALRRLDPAFTGYRVAVVSDIHLGALVGRRHVESIVAAIDSARPDVVAIVGDLADGPVAELGPAAAPLGDLAAPDGAFFVTGNHEYYTGDLDAWLSELRRLGVVPLRNENIPLRRGSGTVDLVGVDDVAGEEDGGGPDFDRALAGTGADRPRILLAHQPVQVVEASRRGIDLQLSGHTHGGQLSPFGAAVLLEQPALAGLSTVGDTQLFVSRGAGFWGPPVRVGAPPDVAVLTLTPR